MKLMFASDIHGSRSACEAVLAAYKAEGAERLVLLGDPAASTVRATICRTHTTRRA